MTHWSYDAIFYHIYPLGLCGAPHTNPFDGSVAPRLRELHAWIEPMRTLGVNALYLGPLFESTSHGYDTADYYTLDRRLGTNATLTEVADELHRNGIRLILDGVFHHVGRDFWAFRDLLVNQQASAYRDWFEGIDFSQRSPYGDPFSYASWDGHFNLVKLNLRNAEVRAHLFGAVQSWIEQFDLDGLRLDVAERLDLEFLRELRQVCKARKPDFWLMGEQIHGDYRRIANPEMLDATTNYEVYKGLYSSHNDRNYFEIAHSLTRQYGSEGVYRGLPLYNFVDNHDVARVASILHERAHLAPIYALLFTIPGVPAIYYGSEWGYGGVKNADDWSLRPQLRLPEARGQAPYPQLADTLALLADRRQRLPALRYGDYTQVHVAAEQLAFVRCYHEQIALVAVNAAASPVELVLPIDLPNGTPLLDWFNQGSELIVNQGRVTLHVPARWASLVTRASAT
ncbi:alpha-amylase family glycosyl hydrolase [Candidatus Chloroploca sp. Khr17]|uniref:alpha-amylase family glycosyl hydrolase n=1 Tax=Candidatus Chloroploca sp. Khr17 TaxID=2496869 RepID=UPI00101D1DBD|nr:alpha-amylase family glycosyl hydrolase [Candidatus Chloroploca sp. Khr17]